MRAWWSPAPSTAGGLTAILLDPSFTQEALEAQRRHVSCPRVHSWTELKSGSKRGSRGSGPGLALSVLVPGVSGFMQGRGHYEMGEGSRQCRSGTLQHRSSVCSSV